MTPANGFSLSPEATVGVLGILVLLVGAIFVFCRWLVSGPRAPEPWGPDVEQALEADEALPVCPHCLAPQEHAGWFCPECGSTVGQYGNYLPYVYIFSIGEGLRAGVERRGPWSPLLATGYFLVAFCHFSILAPIYYLFLMRNRARTIDMLRAPEATEPRT